MNARKLKHCIHCTVVLLLLGSVLGMAGCSKKAIKTASPDVIVADTEPVPIEAASSGDGLTNAGSSGPVTEAFGRVTESRGIVDGEGKIGELEIEIMDSDLNDASGSSAGRSVGIVADELEFGVEGPRGTASRVGEEFIVVQPGTAEGAQTPSGTLSLLEAGQPGPRRSGSADERIVIQGVSSGTVPLTAGGVSVLEAGQPGPGENGSADEMIFIEDTPFGKAAARTGRMLAFAVPEGAVSRGQGDDGEMIVIESARAVDTHAASSGPGEISVEGERQRPARPGAKESTATFLVEERPTGSSVNFSDAPESDAPGSAKGARVSSAGKDENIVAILRPADSGVRPEYVPEPLIFAAAQPEIPAVLSAHETEFQIFAAAQPEIPAVLPARETEPQAPSVASAAVDPFVVKAGFEDIYFDFDRWAIPKPMQARLYHHAQWLKAHPGSAVLIEGHCDVRGSREYNMVLGEKRARSVRDFLLDIGVKDDQLSMISYGKERLTCFESREACHGDNRRAHLLPR